MNVGSLVDLSNYHATHTVLLLVLLPFFYGWNHSRGTVYQQQQPYCNGNGTFNLVNVVKNLTSNQNVHKYYISEKFYDLPFSVSYNITCTAQPSP